MLQDSSERNREREREKFYHCFECSDPRSCSIAMDGFVFVHVCVYAMVHRCSHTVLEHKMCERVWVHRRREVQPSVPIAPSIVGWETTGRRNMEPYGCLPEGGLSTIDRLLNPFSCRSPYSRGVVSMKLSWGTNIRWNARLRFQPDFTLGWWLFFCGFGFFLRRSNILWDKYYMFVSKLEELNIEEFRIVTLTLDD